MRPKSGVGAEIRTVGTVQNGAAGLKTLQTDRKMLRSLRGGRNTVPTSEVASSMGLLGPDFLKCAELWQWITAEGRRGDQVRPLKGCNIASGTATRWRWCQSPIPHTCTREGHDAIHNCKSMKKPAQEPLDSDTKPAVCIDSNFSITKAVKTPDTQPPIASPHASGALLSQCSWELRHARPTR